MQPYPLAAPGPVDGPFADSGYAELAHETPVASGDDADVNPFLDAPPPAPRRRSGALPGAVPATASPSPWATAAADAPAATVPEADDFRAEGDFPAAAGADDGDAPSYVDPYGAPADDVPALYVDPYADPHATPGASDDLTNLFD